MAPRKSVLSIPAKKVDPSLDALFSKSVGPVEARAKPTYVPLVEAKPKPAPSAKAVRPLGEDEGEEEDDDDDDDDEDSDEDDDDEEEDSDKDSVEEPTSDAEDTSVQAATAAAGLNEAPKRKRKNRADEDDLEGRYFDKLAREAEAPAEKRTKRGDEEDGAKEAKGDSDIDSDSDGERPMHESLGVEGGAAGVDAEQAREKAARTVYLSNVSIRAVTDKAAKKTLLAHLASAEPAAAEGKGKDKGKGEDEGEGEGEGEGEDGAAPRRTPKSVVESLRFRSVPFATAALPKRAAYITKAVLGATAQATNAYVVYATAAAARRAVRALNGTVVLDRHLRADSVAHPAPVDHRRCVFVGNLGFVDDETLVSKPKSDDGSGKAAAEPTTRKRKTPMDVEEGLWRTFGAHAGKVESVRVVRDAATRVGKGFAYVQFYDANAVEAALLLADKKFPPLLPRALRVSRCKAPQRTARALERVQRKASGPPAPGFQRRRDAKDRALAAAGAAAAAAAAAAGTTGYTPKLTAEQRTFEGRAAKLLGRSAVAKTKAAGKAKTAAAPAKTASPAAATAAAAAAAGAPVVFEGMRARANSNSIFKKKKGSKGGKGGKAGVGGKGGKGYKGKPSHKK